MMKYRTKRVKIYDYQYEQPEDNYFYNNKCYNKIKYSKNNEYYNKNSIKQKKYLKEYQNNGSYFHKFQNFDDYESFYPKNYEKTKKDSQNNEYDYTNTLNPEKYNNFPKNHNPQKTGKIYKKIIVDSTETFSVQKQNENYSKVEEDKIQVDSSNNNNDKKKCKKSWIKSIPHPKRKKENENGCFQGKKIINYQQKKGEKHSLIKERKLSFSSSQNNESTKQSINTINTSYSSNKEKDVSNRENKEIESNLKISNNLTNNFNKNKFDDENKNIESPEKLQSTNKYLENTEVLQVKVKISESETATFKIKRYDDLFLTISVFCEIYSIDESLMKPIILKTLCALNTIYQVYNCNVSKENIKILKDVKESMI